MFIILPSWNPNKVIKIPLDMLPMNIANKASEGGRLHAHVNLAAEHGEDLFFSSWEAR